MEIVKDFEEKIIELENETVKSPMQFALIKAFKEKIEKLKENDIVEK